MEVILDYDEENDVLFIRFYTDKKQTDIQEPIDGIVVYLANDGTVLGFEIWNAKKRGIIEKLREIIEMAGE
ncbi:MAG: DUF2283 domain-containing protein [Candidatus Njordarchaeota archaeon]